MWLAMDLKSRVRCSEKKAATLINASVCIQNLTIHSILYVHAEASLKKRFAKH